ncbi:MAG: DNA topoisomerase I, partial [Planctomycetaceae bacterium]|nr:DNA topoisomerase I [Planctomycetaceae bacterium]
STYASVISTVQDRGYVMKQGSQLVPTFTGMAVTRLLEQYFPRLVDTKFTARMEDILDEIASGDAERLPYLREFYSGAEGLDEQVKLQEERIHPREACTLQLDGLDPRVRVGRYGPYFEIEQDSELLTASIPDGTAPGDLTNELAVKLIEQRQKGPESLGMHPEEGLEIYVMNGPFGPYLQLGEVTEEGPKPKRVSIPKSMPIDKLTLKDAVDLIALPRRLGEHPVTGKVVTAGVGRFGPYVRHDGVYKSIGKEGSWTDEQTEKTYTVLDITLPAAVELLKQAKPRGQTPPIRELGEHPEEGGQVGVFEGRYGPYVKHGKLNATIPKGREVDSVTLSEALEWLAERAARKGTKKGTKKKAASKKKAPAATKKKAATKKTAKKKTTKKKAAAKKKTS